MTLNSAWVVRVFYTSAGACACVSSIFFVDQQGYFWYYLDAYDSANKSWTEYIEHREHFFLGSDITTPEKKKSILLSYVGAKTYKLIKTLLAPVKPGDKSFQQLVTIIQENECPQRSVIVQRFIFNSGVQKQGESVADFVADLRHLAEHCGAREERSRRHPGSD